MNSSKKKTSFLSSFHFSGRVESLDVLSSLSDATADGVDPADAWQHGDYSRAFHLDAS